MHSPEPVGSNAVKDIVFLPWRKHKHRHDRLGQHGAVNRVTDRATGIILMGPADVVKNGCDPKDIHVRPFRRTDMLAQPKDPKRVIPVVAGARAGEHFFRDCLDIHVMPLLFRSTP